MSNKMNYFGGDSAYVFTQDLDKQTEDYVKEKINETYENNRQAINEKYEQELAEGEEKKLYADQLDMMPLNNYVLVRPYAENPFERMEIQNGIIIPKADGSFKNPDTGEDDTEYNMSVQADVIEVGPMCKYLKPGDVVYYRRSCGVPIPFFRQGFEVVAEPQIHVVLNVGLKERFEKLK